MHIVKMGLNVIDTSWQRSCQWNSLKKHKQRCEIVKWNVQQKIWRLKFQIPLKWYNFSRNSIWTIMKDWLTLWTSYLIILQISCYSWEWKKFFWHPNIEIRSWKLTGTKNWLFATHLFIFLFYFSLCWIGMFITRVLTDIESQYSKCKVYIYIVDNLPKKAMIWICKKKHYK